MTTTETQDTQITAVGYVPENKIKVRFNKHRSLVEKTFRQGQLFHDATPGYQRRKIQMAFGIMASKAPMRYTRDKNGAKLGDHMNFQEDLSPARREFETALVVVGLRLKVKPSQVMHAFITGRPDKLASAIINRQLNGKPDGTAVPDRTTIEQLIHTTWTQAWGSGSPDEETRKAEALEAKRLRQKLNASAKPKTTKPMSTTEVGSKGKRGVRTIQQAPAAVAS